MHKPIIAIALLCLLALGCADSEPVSLEFRIAQDEAAPGLTEMTAEPGNAPLYVHPEILLDESDVAGAEVTVVGDCPAVALRLTPEGARAFTDLTAAHIGERCAMAVDGRLVSAPVIRETISGGRAIITGDFTAGEARRIADGLGGR